LGKESFLSFKRLRSDSWGRIVSFILQHAEVRQLGKDSFHPLSFRRLRSDSWGSIVSFILQQAEVRQLGKDSFLYISAG
jgi:hypothetical protein